MIAAALLPTVAGSGCVGDTTPKAYACLKAQAGAADRDIRRYLGAVRTRTKRQLGEPSDPATLVAQKHWLEWDIRLTKARTPFLWRTYLTYPDSTPPILPEPDRAD